MQRHEMILWFYRKSICPIIWLVFGKDQPDSWNSNFEQRAPWRPQGETLLHMRLFQWSYWKSYNLVQKHERPLLQPTRLIVIKEWIVWTHFIWTQTKCVYIYVYMYYTCGRPFKLSNLPDTSLSSNNLPDINFKTNFKRSVGDKELLAFCVCCKQVFQIKCLRRDYFKHPCNSWTLERKQ